MLLRLLKRWFFSTVKTGQRKWKCPLQFNPEPKAHMGLTVFLKSRPSLCSFSWLRSRRSLVKILMLVGSCMLKVEHLLTFMKLMIRALYLSKISDLFISATRFSTHWQNVFLKTSILHNIFLEVFSYDILLSWRAGWALFLKQAIRDAGGRLLIIL